MPSHFGYHPYCMRTHDLRISCYWAFHGKTVDDKKPGRTFKRSNGSLGCDECCNGDRCDDPSHYDRSSCPYCLGSGTNATI
jgi:hypothetical protein